MQTFEDIFTSSLDVVLSAVGLVPLRVGAVDLLDDAAILRAERKLGEITRAVEACAALVAGVIAHRSRPNLGHSGLAQREGFRNAEALVQRETGSTTRGASALVQIGRMMRDAATPRESLAADGIPARQPWLAEVGLAVANKTISIQCAQAISDGLGSLSGHSTAGSAEGATLDNASLGVTVELLTMAARTLLFEITTTGTGAPRPENLFRRARELRDELDEAGIADREQLLHRQRSVRRVRRPNGLCQFIITPDIESAAFWNDVYDKMTSPRRGGARFVSEADQSRAAQIACDERTLEQFAHDAFTQLLRIAVAGETDASRQIIGSRQPTVRVLVTATALRSRAGHGRIEGSDLAISMASVERIACETGTVELTFDPTRTQPLDLGREQRLFSRRQRIALAARDGGCMAGDCECPPSWCEAHHLNHWHRDNGLTNVADGILLCRFHHLLLHNNDWRIYRDPHGYWLVPPASVDCDQTPRLMPPKSAALRDLQREAG